MREIQATSGFSSASISLQYGFSREGGHPLFGLKRCSRCLQEPISLHCDGQARAKDQISTCVLLKPHRSELPVLLRSRAQYNKTVLWGEISKFYSSRAT